MYLRSLRVENYRAIRRASITFSTPTTVFIGENDSGRTSLMEALALVLDARHAPLERRHFYQADGRVAGPIRVQVHLQESVPGDWNPPRHIADAWPAEFSAARSLHLEWAASYCEGEAIRESWRARIDERSALRFRDDLGLLDWVRRIVPLICLRDGFRPELHPWAAVEAGAHLEPEMLDLLSRLQSHYVHIVSGASSNLEAELESGAQVAQAILARYPSSRGAATDVSTAVREIMGQDTQQARSRPLLTNVASQKIGLMLVIGAVLRVLSYPPEHGSHPILVIDSPEIHLHPMTLATVWHVLETIPWQKIVGTHSDELLASAPLSSMRRLTREGGVVREWFVKERSISREELRRLTYHVRSRRGAAMFSRCWLLVEGETEFWVLPELARLLGYDFGAEGISCVEFAQCGLSPLIRVASHLGIEWHLLADGDDAGQRYIETGRRLSRPGALEDRFTQLKMDDIENCFAAGGFVDLFRELARAPERSSLSPKQLVRRALEKHPKPYVALRLVEAVAKRGPDSIPPVLVRTIECCVKVARAPRRS